MEENVILSQIDKIMHRKKVDELAKLAANQQFSLEPLIELTFHKDLQIGFRAAWVLEQLCIKNREKLEPHLGYFLSRFAHQQNQSARRHFTKILSLLTEKKSAYRSIIHSENAPELVETVFSWLLDKQSPVAVKAHCLSILANFSPAHQWIKDELLQTIDFMVDQESIAFHARAKQVRRQLVR